MPTFFSHLFIYIRRHPFSTMALANMIGDVCYLGYAFASDQWVSFSKLFGALFALTAHIILLAYGDDQLQQISSESGWLPRLLLTLREKALWLLKPLPTPMITWMRLKPVGITFSMLAVNGAGLFIDAWLTLNGARSLSMIIQGLMGVFIVVGTAIFAIADFVRTQSRANFFMRLAPVVLSGASLLSVALALFTLNPFIFVSVLAFLVSNFAAFFTKIDKNMRLSTTI